MPNHITNILDVTGSKKLVEAFKNKVYRKGDKTKGEDAEHIFDFETTVPMPKSMHITCPARTDKEKEIYAENKAQYGAGDWHEFGCKFFGTKWNAYSACEPEKIESGIRFRFDTAWSPPAQWINTTAKQFPELKFRDRWIEGGGAGDYTVWTEAGVTQDSDEPLSDHDWNYEFDSNYREEYDIITKGDYDELIDTYVTHEGEIENPDLQKAFVNRVKAKDLPLLVGLDTLYDETKSLIEERLKGTQRHTRKIRA